MTANKLYRYWFFCFVVFFQQTISSQIFPNPTTLSTGQGTVGSNDPIWTCSQWYTTEPTSTSGATYTPALINNNCAPNAWISPATLAPPLNNANWITGADSDCSQNRTSGYRFFRLTLNLPSDCNGFSVTQAGNYTLTFSGYVDNSIRNVFLNNNPLGITGGGYAAGSELTITINGPWNAGINYIDILVYNTPSANANDINPYGLLMVANTNSINGNDTDGDGIQDMFDDCICDPGNTPNGCVDPTFTCNVDQIRSAFTNANYIELEGCWDACSMYFLNTQSMTGSQAQAFARNLGANLISIQSAAENQCILDELVRLNQTGVIWIGFNDERTEGTFEWYDQSPATYTNWSQNEPNNMDGIEDCVQIYPTISGSNPAGKWNDLSCNSANSKSIIEVNLCPVTTVTPPITICQEQTANFGVTSTILGSDPYTYAWDNGVNTNTQSTQPMQSTNYVVTTKDRYNCQRLDTVFVTVNEKPIAEFSFDDRCKSTAIINFTNESSVSTNNLSYNWNFETGQNATTENPSHTFSSFGNQTVQLIVQTPQGCRDTIIKSVPIFAKPNADFTYNTSCDPNPSIVLQNTSSTADNSNLNFNWNLGNNQTSTETSPTVTFNQPNGNSVTLIVATANGCLDTIIKNVDLNVLPTADFTFTPACIDEAIQMTSTSSIADNTPLTLAWNFGNGQTSSNASTSTTYTASGNHNVTLIATSTSGCSDTITKAILVYNTPNAPIVITNSPVACPGDEFTFSVQAISGASYFWSGPNNFTSNNPNNKLTAENEVEGNYTVYISINGCESPVSTISLDILGQLVPLVTDFPNVITPNNDGINDVLDMNQYFSSCLSFKIVLFNRWGNQVWEQESAGPVFEGKDMNSGNPLADGVYFYKLTYGSEERQGFITIVRK